MYIHFGYSFTSGWVFGLSQHGAIMNDPLTNFPYRVLHGHMFHFSWQIPRSGITGSRVSLCLIVKKLPNCFQSDCVLFHIPTSNKWQPQFMHSLANTCCSLFLLLLIIAILMGVKLHLTVILICISSMTYDVEHLFFYLLAICVYFLVNSSYLLPPFY